MLLPSSRLLRLRPSSQPLLLIALCLFGGSLTLAACSDSDNGKKQTPEGQGGDSNTGGDGEGDGDFDEDNIEAPTAELSSFIVVDQFGYRPQAEKIAVIRDPQIGFDSAESFTPGSSYELINAKTKESVLVGAPVSWNNGATHDQSGDVAWHFDFSSISEPGLYYVLDVEKDVRSDLFQINSQVYREVLKQAVRSFFYQRAGFEKKAEFAGEAWADGASHVGAGQDKNARLYSDTNNTSTERDLSGGWYDAGDMNKYTAWTADYIVTMARTYTENPDVFGDDYNIPESGNGVADLLDEMQFGVKHLLRLQENDGSVLSIVDLEGASPPSSATEPSRYGPASTNSTIRACAAYAWASRVLEASNASLATELKTAAENAWTWAIANPDVVFANNDGNNDLGAGQQQPSDDDVIRSFMPAAIALYQLTAEQSYLDYFETNFDQQSYALFQYTWLSGYQLDTTDAYLDYIDLPEADSDLVEAFVTPFITALSSDDNLGMLTAQQDPYLARAPDVQWGSNSVKSLIGSLFYSFVLHDIDSSKKQDAARAAERYIHAIHGVNPLSLVYLSNMGDFGASNSVSQFYHSWFADGSDWDEVGVSKFGPPPGFLVGGPNSNYNWDAQCPGHESCPAEVPAPPFGQPDLKSYAQFNDNWPLNSWEVTENSNGYQMAYIRLLSKFVE